MSLFHHNTVSHVPVGRCGTLTVKVSVRDMTAADTILHIYKGATLVAAYAATSVAGSHVTYQLDSAVTGVPGAYSYSIKPTLNSDTDLQQGLLVVEHSKPNMDVLYGPCDHT